MLKLDRLKLFNLQCALGLHPWVSWKTLEKAATASGAITQQRDCPVCGKTQLRTEKP